MDGMNRDLAYRILGAFFLGGGLAGLCFEFQKWRQEIGVTALILFSIAYGLIFLFMIFGPARLRLNRAVRDLLVAWLWSLLFCTHAVNARNDLIGTWLPAILAGVYVCLALAGFYQQHRSKTKVPQSAEPLREQPHAR